MVVKHGDRAVAADTDSSEPVSARKKWGGPAGTALNVLQGAEILESPESTTGSKEAETPGECTWKQTGLITISLISHI